MMIQLFFLLARAWAEDGGAHATHAAHEAGHHAVEIPWGNLFVQTFNVVLLFAILIFALRKAVKAHFEHRARDYKQLVERAEAAKAEAERGKQEIAQRLAKLEASADQSLNQARKEAEELKTRMMKEANTLSEKLEQEARRSAAVELEKAKAELRAELLGQALKASRENLSKNLSSSEQKKLHNEFAEKIEVVGQ